MNPITPGVAHRQEAVLATNSLIRNTYILLSLTLLFSAFTAALSMAFNLPHPGLVITLIGYFGLLFVTVKLKNSAWGLLSIFALTGFMGLTLGPIISFYLTQFSNGSELVMMAMGGTAVIFLGLSGYALTTRKDFSFMGGSMGSVMGEKLTRLVEEAIPARLPLVLVASSGGARMQEGTLSLMQMAKTSAALARFAKEGLLYISVLSDPTTGGVSASFAMQADLILAEPGAIIGFAGRRVIEATIHQKAPSDFQTAEWVFKHGHIDQIVPRPRLRDALGLLIGLHTQRKLDPARVAVS